MSESEQLLYRGLTIFTGVLAGVVFAALFKISAPYGRHVRKGWGPVIAARRAWVLMEFPAVLILPMFFVLGDGIRMGPGWVFLGLWWIHYLHRSLVYPIRLKPSASRVPSSIVLFGLIFHLDLGYLNGRYLGLHAGDYGSAWFLGAPFIVGASLFALGFALNIHADRTLLRLKGEGGGYQIPRGGLYRWVSCPNYLGEIIEWTGWAVATWSVPGLLFAVWTAANLVPRAVAHHAWYRRTFAEYPTDRRAIIPWLL